MIRPKPVRWFVWFLMALILVQTGCVTLAADTRVSPPAEAKHCEGSEIVTSTQTASVPIPVIAFFVPRIEGNVPEGRKVLAKCGGAQQLNRVVEVNYAPCLPIDLLSTFLTLGVIAFCPTVVHYEADVVE